MREHLSLPTLLSEHITSKLNMNRRLRSRLSRGSLCACATTCRCTTTPPSLTTHSHIDFKQASEIQIESRELVRMRDYLSLLISDHTGQPYDRVIRELSRNKWMNPKEVGFDLNCVTPV